MLTPFARTIPLSFRKNFLSGWLLLLFSIIPLLAALATAAAAQPAARLEGRVEDENGLVVAGVEIVARFPRGQAQTVYSDQTGRFNLQLAGPGKYLVSLSKAGFFRLTDQPVELQAGNNEVSFVLNHETEIRETVQVTSSSNRVEPQETEHQRSLVAREIRDIPVPSTHDLLSTLPALPGVLRDNTGALHIAGARAGETLYRLDGFEVGHPATNQLDLRVNVDTVRNVEVESGRYGAAYAHAGAAVLSLDTAVGDDRWRFGVTNFVPGLSLQRGVHFGNWFPRVTFSGPLRKGRAWFSEAASLQHTFDLITEQPPGADTATKWVGDNLFRVQVNLTPRHVLHGSFLVNRLSGSHLGLGPFAPLSTTTDLDSRRYFVALKHHITLARTVLELGAAFDRGSSDRVPQGSGIDIRMPTGRLGNFFETSRERARRWQVLGDVLMPSRHWRGPHDLQIGFNLDGVAFDHFAERNPIEVLRADGTLLQRSTFLGTAQFRLTNTQVGVFVQDTWRPAPRLIFQGGLRGDRDEILGRGLVQPRVSANFLPFSDQRAKLSIGWGSYYQPLDLRMLGQRFDQQQEDVFFDATGRVPVLGPALSRFALPAGGLAQPRFYTTSLEWVQRFGEKTTAGVNLTVRNGCRGLVYEAQTPGSPDPGEPGAVFVLQNHRRDRYRGLELSFRRMFSPNAEVSINYMRARARSNEVLDESLGALLFAPRASGPVAWDAPNRLLAWGWTPLPVWRLFFSYFLEYRTGFPFSVVNEQQQLVGPPNRRRFPDYFSLNLGIEKRFRFHGKEWALRLAVINSTNHRNPDSVINNIDAPNFLTFAGGQKRAFTGRLRLVGRSEKAPAKPAKPKKTSSPKSQGGR